MKDCQLILKQSISELISLDGIIFYSIFQLPANEKQRSNIYSEVMLKEKTLYFAVENLSAKSIFDFTLVEDIWSIKKILPECFAPQSLNQLGLK
jgi:sporadic carbohydrate cluster protein (TIGR04323 family)